jgi:hypothetical protein
VLIALTVRRLFGENQADVREFLQSEHTIFAAQDSSMIRRALLQSHDSARRKPRPRRKATPQSPACLDDGKA